MAWYFLLNDPVLPTMVVAGMATGWNINYISITAVKERIRNEL